MLQTAHILNVLNVVDKEYTNAQIYWALPFQIIYEKVRFKNTRAADPVSMDRESCLYTVFQVLCTGATFWLCHTDWI